MSTNLQIPPQLVWRIPPEVLGQIFEACLPTTDDLNSLQQRDVTSFKRAQLQPYVLAAVCRRWRETCRDWPRAWTVLHLDLDNATPERVDCWTAHATRVLARSKVVPFSIHIHRLKRRGTDAHIPLIQLLNPHLRRCVGLFVRIGRIWDTEPLIELLKAPMPVLRVARLCSHWAADTFIGDAEFLAESPHLVHLTVGSAFVPRTSRALATLRSARIIDPYRNEDSDDFTSFLEGATCLEDLEVVDPNIADDWTGPAIRCPTLRRLSVDVGCNEMSALQFGKLVEAPGLRSLALRGNRSTSAERIDLVRELAIDASPRNDNNDDGDDQIPQLEELELSDVPEDDLKDLATLIHDLPRLRRFALVDAELSLTGLTSICNMHVSEGAPRHPTLRNIELVGCEFVARCQSEQELQQCHGARVEAAGSGIQHMTRCPGERACPQAQQRRASLDALLAGVNAARGFRSLGSKGDTLHVMLEH